MRSVTPPLLGLLLLVALSACGGGSDEKRLSHAELVEQGNAICVAASGKIDALGDPASLADIARIGAKLAAIRRDETAKLAALEVAKDDEDGQAELVSALRARDATLKQLVSAARKQDQAAATKALAAGQPLGDTASNLALDLGLLRCAEGG
jgi:hypothetical protein